MIFLTICSNIYNGNATNITNISDCFVSALFGQDYLVFGFFLVFFIMAVAYYFRIPNILSLMLGFSIVYMLDMISGGNPALQMVMLLLGLGMAIVLATGVFSYVKQYSQ